MQKKCLHPFKGGMGHYKFCPVPVLQLNSSPPPLARVINDQALRSDGQNETDKIRGSLDTREKDTVRLESKRPGQTMRWIYCLYINASERGVLQQEYSYPAILPYRNFRCVVINIHVNLSSHNIMWVASWLQRRCITKKCQCSANLQPLCSGAT